jgi:hypothetical protein
MEEERRDRFCVSYSVVAVWECSPCVGWSQVGRVVYYYALRRKEPEAGSNGGVSRMGVFERHSYPPLGDQHRDSQGVSIWCTRELERVPMRISKQGAFKRKI